MMPENTGPRAGPDRGPGVPAVAGAALASAGLHEQRASGMSLPRGAARVSEGTGRPRTTTGALSEAQPSASSASSSSITNGAPGSPGSGAPQ